MGLTTVNSLLGCELLSGLLYPTTNAQKPNIAASYSYDGVGRLLNVSSPFVVFAKFSYDSNDQIKGIQYGNGLLMNYTYDPVGRISLEQLNNTATHTTLLRLAYTYNNTGTVASVTGQNNQVKVNEQYKYDPLQRIINSNATSQGSNQVISYSFDNLGNRLSQTVNRTTTNYSYNSTNNELTSAGTTTYTYDNNGNLLSKTIGSVRWTYTWDSSNRLLKVGNGSTQGVYAYDGNGRMVESMEGSPTNFFAYLGAATLWKNGTDYIYAGSQLIAFTSDNLSYHTPRYYHTDALGSVRLMTKDDATVWYSDGYQPYGQDNGTPTCPTCPTAPQLKFTGKPVSATTGLYYYYHRWYDPSVGRFVSEDSLPSRLSDPQSSNKYGYVNNAPTTFTDPSGLGMIVGNGRLPCWDWFGFIPCHQGGTAGAVSTITTTSSAGGPEGPLIAIGVIGIYVGGSALYNFLANYFARNPPSTTNPGVGGNDGSDRTTPSPTSSSTGRIGTGPTIRVPGLSTGLGDFGNSGGVSNVKGFGDTGWSPGFSNNYQKLLRKVIGNVWIHAFCTGGALLVAGSLWALETEESGRQNIQNAETGADSIFGVWLSVCYAGAVVGTSVRGSF